MSEPVPEQRIVAVEAFKLNVFKFGETETSDVVLAVGEKEFHAHKGFLAVRSSFFQTMFFSDDKRSVGKRIVIEEADAVAFKRLMEMLYYGRIEDKQFLRCDLFRCRNEDSVHKFWTEASALLSLADRFAVLPYVLGTFQFLLLTNECADTLISKSCYRGAAKLIMAMIYRMDDYMKVSVSDRATLSNTLDVLEKAQKDLTGLTHHIAWLLRRE